MQDISPNINGLIPLHLAAKYGYGEIVQKILVVVEDKNPKDKWGGTPLHKAARFGHAGVVEMILDVVDEKNPIDDNGQTPLSLANNEDYDDIEKMILDAMNKDSSKEKFLDSGFLEMDSE